MTRDEFKNLVSSMRNGMPDDEWEDFIELCLMTCGGLDILEQQIEIGVKNGYSREKQIELLRTMFEKL